jgi:hypothetical protein
MRFYRQRPSSSKKASIARLILLEVVVTKLQCRSGTPKPDKTGYSRPDPNTPLGWHSWRGSCRYCPQSNMPRRVLCCRMRNIDLVGMSVGCRRRTRSWWLTAYALGAFGPVRPQKASWVGDSSLKEPGLEEQVAMSGTGKREKWP